MIAVPILLVVIAASFLLGFFVGVWFWFSAMRYAGPQDNATPTSEPVGKIDGVSVYMSNGLKPANYGQVTLVRPYKDQYIAPVRTKIDLSDLIDPKDLAQ